MCRGQHLLNSITAPSPPLTSQSLSGSSISLTQYSNSSTQKISKPPSKRRVTRHAKNLPDGDYISIMMIHVSAYCTERARGDFRTRTQTQTSLDTLLLNHFAHDLISYHNPTIPQSTHIQIPDKWKHTHALYPQNFATPTTDIPPSDSS